ncbi:MmyB family transcriptional regulator [Streptomyces sp. NBC_00306]|uniref:MmyB family transcriptional regulator n=1 Tax=Streptomyces sp. NBC_00306 TaxID=2975708 RepID=UPI002E2A7852|nr:hypothetical protein [Streptomyces sp. NBC_00306]
MSKAQGTRFFHHPRAGTLVLDWDTLTSSTVPDQHLVIWTAPPDSASERGLRLLASATARSEAGKTSYSPPHSS